jgi:hypothetical protein
MTTMTKTTIMAIRTMTNFQEPDTMYVHFETVPLHVADAFPVLVVPHHLRTWRDVRRNATH